MNIDYLIISLASTSVTLLILSIVLIVKNSRAKKKLKVLSATYLTMQSLLDLKNSKISDNDVHKENFIKFLSDSRDSAFEYIETFQNELERFVSEVDSSISYFDEYGEVLSTNRPDYDSLKIISKAYKELKKLLPDEESR